MAITAKQVPPSISVRQVESPSPQKAPQVALGTMGGSSFLAKNGISAEHQATFQKVYEGVWAYLSQNQQINDVRINLHQNYVSYRTVNGKQVVHLNELSENHELVKLIEPTKAIAGKYLNPSRISPHRFGSVTSGTEPALSTSSSSSTMLQNLPKELKSFLKGPEIPFYSVLFHLKEYCSKPYFDSLIQSIQAEKRPEAAARVFAIEKYFSSLRNHLTAQISLKEQKKEHETLDARTKHEKELAELKIFLSHLQAADPFALYWASAHLDGGSRILAARDAEEHLKETFRTTHRYRNGKKEEPGQRTPKGEYARDVGDLLASTPSELHARLEQEGRAPKAERIERLLIHHMNGTYTDEDLAKVLAPHGVSFAAEELSKLLKDAKKEAAVTAETFSGCTTPKAILSKARAAKLYS